MISIALKGVIRYLQRICTIEELIDAIKNNTDVAGIRDIIHHVKDVNQATDAEYSIVYRSVMPTRNGAIQFYFTQYEEVIEK